MSGFNKTVKNFDIQIYLLNYIFRLGFYNVLHCTLYKLTHFVLDTISFARIIAKEFKNNTNLIFRRKFCTENGFITLCNRIIRLANLKYRLFFKQKYYN